MAHNPCNKTIRLLLAVCYANTYSGITLSTIANSHWQQFHRYRCDLTAGNSVLLTASIVPHSWPLSGGVVWRSRCGVPLWGEVRRVCAAEMSTMTPDTWAENSKVSNGKIRCVKQTEILTHVPHVNGWFPAVYRAARVKISICFTNRNYRSKLSNFSAHVSGASNSVMGPAARLPPFTGAQEANSALLTPWPTACQTGPPRSMPAMRSSRRQPPG